jgi:hypothetical protein
MSFIMHYGSYELDYRILSILLGGVGLGLLIWVVRLRRANVMLQEEVDELGKQLEEAVKRLAQFENEPKSKTFTKIVDLLAAAGIPGLVLLAAMAISGFSGAAAITVALSSIGGPAGMIGGIGVLVTLGVVIAKYGVTDVGLAVVRKLLNTRSKDALIQEIEALPKVVPQKFRMKARSMLEGA